MIEMHFYVFRTKDGLYHVQNVVMGRLGQHHVHTEEGFKRWAKGIPERLIHMMMGECNCGLRPGDVMEYNGKVWHNPEFE